MDERRAQVPGSLGLTPAQVELLLTTAGRAPSLHNSQPWQFHVTARAIELHADPRRSPEVADPDGREMRMACGAALFNLQLALRGHAIRPIVTIFPDRGRPRLLAVVRHGGTKHQTPEQGDLLRAVPLWRTNRHPFADTPVDTAALHALRRAANDEGAWLHIVQDPAQRTSVRVIAARAHREQSADPAFRAELAAWTAAAPGRRDGVPARAGGAIPEAQDAWVRRDFTAGTGIERVPGKDFEQEPVIAVLSSHLSGPTAEVRVGEALERVLLTASVNGLATSFLSHVVEVPHAREELRRLIGGTHPPQAVLRIGHGWPVGATPRRDVSDLLTQEQAST
ncbi:MAG TPA: nitroreductase [Pseudonocardia sp.]